jgi:hypothetical protein
MADNEHFLTMSIIVDKINQHYSFSATGELTACPNAHRSRSHQAALKPRAHSSLSVPARAARETE